tara:strand:+ start:117 stop:461 length:345 start_codon:yes stop_codon:yes gene_type:complete
MSQFFSGINVSTQSQKIVILDLENDSIIYSDSINYDENLPQYETTNGLIRNTQPIVSESNPNMRIDGFHLLFKRLSKKTDIISSIKLLYSSISLKIRGLEGPDPFDLRKKFFKN